jgi:hypothetical protein
MKQFKFSICLSTCYFGQQFPDYFEYFLRTAAWNNSVDFIIFSDNPPIEPCPSNVKFVQITLSEFSSLASQKMSLSVSVINPYKLNDFKPAYGLLFESYFAAYDFWGSIDIYILLGNIRQFLPDALLEERDFIVIKNESISNVFCLYRNNDSLRCLFMKSSHWQQVFATNDYLCFDNFVFTLQDLQRYGITITEKEPNFEAMADVLDKEDGLSTSSIEAISHELQFRELLEVSADGIKRIGKEGKFLLINFAILNNEPRYKYPKLTNAHDKFYADVFGIMPCDKLFVLTVEERDNYVLGLPVLVNYDKVMINDDNTVVHKNGKGEWIKMSDMMLLNAQILLLVHYNKQITSKEIIDFFIKSKVLTLQKAVPPTDFQIGMLMLNFISLLKDMGLVILK